jgi:hypothetical protein
MLHGTNVWPIPVAHTPATDTQIYRQAIAEMWNKCVYRIIGLPEGPWDQLSWHTVVVASRV